MASKKNQVEETLEQRIYNTQKMLKDLRAQYKRIETKSRYRQSEELDAEMEAAVDAIADAEADLEALQEQYQEQERERLEQMRAQERERLQEKAQGFTFQVPDDDPVLACTMLAAIAQRLQYDFCRMQGPYEALTAKVYGRGPNGEGNGEQTGTHSDPSYEFNRSDVDKLDNLRERREYVQTLRFAVAKHFEAMKEKIPEDASFIPQLYSQSDEERYRILEERNAQRFAEQQEARRKAGESMKEFTRMDLGVAG